MRRLPSSHNSPAWTTSMRWMWRMTTTICSTCRRRARPRLPAPVPLPPIPPPASEHLQLGRVSGAGPAHCTKLRRPHDCFYRACPHACARPRHLLASRCLSNPKCRAPVAVCGRRVQRYEDEELVLVQTPRIHQHRIPPLTCVSCWLLSPQASPPPLPSPPPPPPYTPPSERALPLTSRQSRPPLPRSPT